jgi:hypothetical protein
MTEFIQFTLKPELLGTLGTLARTPVSTISPFNYGKDAPTGLEAIAELAVLGICDEQGNLLNDKKEAVTTLATADAFTRLYLTTQDGITEYIAYFSPEEKIAGITNDGGMQLITFPAANDAMLERIRQILGFSIYRNGSFTADLSRAETLVLSAMIDLQRKEMLRKFADGVTATSLVHTPRTISEMLEVTEGNFQWFSSAFIDLFTRDHVPKPDAIGSVLASLAAKGLAIHENNGYTLSDDGILLSRGHLMPTMYLTMTSGKATSSGTTNAAGFSCIISGIHDLLYIDYNGDDVELRSVASSEIHDYVSAFLKDTAVIAKLDSLSQKVPAPSPETPAKVQRFCPSCGSSIQPGKKFCPQCGVKIN